MPSLMAAWSGIQVLLGISFIIFVHELGHFLVARWCGVRCPLFSVGMGPRLIGWRKDVGWLPAGGFPDGTSEYTEYQLAVFPVGGYVIMAGEEESTGRDDELASKSSLQRAAIFLAGVTMNIIFAAIFFLLAFTMGVKFIAPQVGAVAPGSPAWHAGIQEGDLITRIGSAEIINFDQVSLNLAFVGKEGVEVELRRGDQTLTRRVVPEYSESMGVPVIGVAPSERPDRLYVDRDGYAYNQGMRTGDRLISVNGETGIRSNDELGDRLNSIAGEGETQAIKVVYQRGQAEPQEVTIEVPAREGFLVGLRQGTPLIGEVRASDPATGEAPSAGGAAGFKAGDLLREVAGSRCHSLRQAEELLTAWLADPAQAEVSAATVVVRRGEQDVTLSLPRERARQAIDDLAGELPEGQGALVGSAVPGSPAEAAGITPGSRVTRFGDAEISSFVDLIKAVAEAKGEAREVHWVDADGAQNKAQITPRRVTKVGANVGFGFDRKLTEELRYPIGKAALTGIEHSRDLAVKVALMVKALFTRKVSTSNLGGPILIAQVSYAYVDRFGFGRFLYFLGLLSVNLAVLNLVPIPGLDGGHLLLLFAETARGEALPETAVAIYRYLGLFMILALIVFVFFNDIMRLLR